MRFLILLTIVFLFSCVNKEVVQNETQQFLDNYSSEFQKLYYASAEAEWRSNTYIVEGDTATSNATQRANKALAKFTGSKENIEKARQLLQQKDLLKPIQVKQLETVLYQAANNPETVEQIVDARIKAETEQTEKLYGFDFKIDDKSVSTNDIDDILRVETNMPKRLAAWESSKEVGKGLKSGLTNLQKLRNETVQALGYSDFFSYQVSDYGMTTKEMMDLNKRLVEELMPLYRELHTYARYELAKKYGVSEVPDYLPAHWLPNRWGQDWSSMVDVKGIDLDGVLKDKGAQWLVEQAERFYVSLGMEKLPAIFWEKSSLYPAPIDAAYKKNNHASAWHMDLENDVRSLMSVVPNSEWYETTHHELGHIYYYILYTNPDVPLLLRAGANRAFHEAIGSMLGLAAMQKPFLQNLDLVPSDIETDQMQSLLKEALNYVVFIPWSAGVMTEFEYELYANNLPENQFNAKWWEMVKKYQGIVPPSDRGEEYCDAASKTHINNDAAQYYDYALSYVLLFQLHNYIATKILNEDPHSTNYYGNKEVGNFLKQILSPGASVDWRKLMQDTLGEEISANAMLEYFAPLMEYLKKENEGRKYTI
ncbi:MAG: M2 family metallopeptidase [Calditrichae bacterium]|nr:M2 family metallopeptidase [Calditrichota bacterium]MCB9058284.1 M2 family metallopeptidase [Calditrichia bacterium]